MSADNVSVQVYYTEPYSTVKRRSAGLTTPSAASRMKSMSRSPIITLTTDFGTADGYVGTMKGVLLDIAPHATLVDITHEITPQDVREAAYILHTAYRFFPPETVHLVVVDPGVGSRRRPIALQLSRGIFVGPDNGIFSYVSAEESTKAIVELADSRYRLPVVSQTFHGRDIFAPAAAHLAEGIPMDELGPPVSDPVSLSLPRIEIGPQRIKGQVLHTDHFGNAITSIGYLRWREGELSFAPAFRRQAVEQASFRANRASAVVAGREIRGLRRTYSDAAPGELVALVGSEGHLEIAIREGSAAKSLGLRPGDSVELRW